MLLFSALRGLWHNQEATNTQAEWIDVDNTVKPATTILHILKYAFSSNTLRYFASRENQFNVVEISEQIDGSTSSKSETLCTEHPHTDSFMFGKYLHLPCKNPNKSFCPSMCFEMLSNRLDCLKKFSISNNLPCTESSIEEITHKFKTIHSQGYYNCNGGRIYRDQNTMVKVALPQKESTSLLARAGVWECAAGTGMLHFHNIITKEIHSIRTWCTEPSTAVLLAGGYVYIASEGKIKKLPILDLWKINHEDLKGETSIYNDHGKCGIIFYGTYNECSVARKQFRSTAETDLERELEFLSIIGYHKNIVEVIGTTTTNYGKEKSIILKRGGRSLSEILADSEVELSIEQILKLVIGIATGLHHIHSHNIIHCDLKPENILEETYEPQLCDFGKTRYIDEKSGNSYGTPDYMPPDLKDSDWQGFYPVEGTYVDMFSFGKVLCQIVAKRSPAASSGILLYLKTIAVHWLPYRQNQHLVSAFQIVQLLKYVIVS